MTKTKLISIVAILFATTASAASRNTPTRSQPMRSQSETASLGYVGALLGPSFWNYGIGTQFGWGAHAGYNVMPNLTAGLYVTHSSLAPSLLPTMSYAASGAQAETIVAAEANYYPFEGMGAFVGAKAGIGITSLRSYSTSIGLGTAPQITTTSTNVAGGPAAGYIHKIANNFSVGGEINYIFVNCIATNVNSFNLMASLNYLF